MTVKKITRLMAILLTLAMMLPFASCDLFKTPGSLKLESLVVDYTSIKTDYEVGDKVDFSGIKVTAKYNDTTLNKTYTAKELTISDLTDITATAGEKKVTISFMDPHLNVKQETTVTIKVTEKAPEQTTPDGGEDGPDPVALPEVVEFLKPATLVAFDAQNKVAGTLEYGVEGFASQFAVGGQVYVIGNQNEFKLNPSFAVWDETLNDGEGDTVEIKEFFTTVELSIKKDGEYVALTATAKENNVVEYSDGDVLIATVNTYKGTYQFTADAADKEVKISVMPSEEKYVVGTDINSVVLEAKVINAYNVYEAWQLAVVDNSNAAWADFKAKKGLTGVNVSGIVLHSDIALTADDVPESFFYTTTKEVVYTNTVTSETITVPVGTKYLIDGTMIYERSGVAEFTIEGNFFTIDTKNFPIVPSPAVFGNDAGKHYGDDFSNAALFRFVSVDWDTVVAGTKPEDVANVTLNNIALIGNAKRDNLIDATDKLASAGGLIFFKASHYTNVKMDNIIGNSYFITYFSDYGADLYVSNSKCYDSYQNAAFVWGNSSLELVDTYVNGCGGPVIIAQSVIKENSHPTVTVTGGKLETHLSGQEIWFDAVNASSIVGTIKALGSGLNQFGLGNFVDKNGNMNIIGALMASGTDADEIVTGIGAQGSIFIGEDGMDRTQSANQSTWMDILNICNQLQAAPAFLTVYDAQGTAHTIIVVDDKGTTLDMSLQPFTGAGSQQITVAEFMKADKIVLSQGGLSVVFDFYHGADAYQVPAN